MLSRSSSSSIVRAEHRMRFAVRYASMASERRFGPCSSTGSRPCPASSISSRSRRVGDPQIRRAEALAVTTAVDREVRPVLSPAFPEAHNRNSPGSEPSSDEESAFVSTALARTKSATSEGRYRTDRPSRRNLGPLPRCRHARSVATDSPSSSATSRSVSARAESDARSRSVLVARGFMTPPRSACCRCRGALERPARVAPARHRSRPAEFEWRVFR